MIYGTFKSISGIDYIVQIKCGMEYEIGSTDRIRFTDNPITIKQEIDDTFTHIIKTSCDINLLVKDYIGDSIFTANDREIEVRVYKNDANSRDNCIFYGFLVPNTYNQDFAEVYTEITLNCQDWLCTLENHKWKEETNYDVLKQMANTISFKEIISYIFGVNSAQQLDKFYYYYDLSVKVEASGCSYKNVFATCGISETLILGDEEDDLWTCEEILEQILQYLNLHIILIGDKLFFFNWDKVRTEADITFYDFFRDTNYTVSERDIDLVKKDYYKSDDTQISLADVYNKIVLKCDLQQADSVFKSPLDSDSLVSPYTNKNTYAHCQWVEGESTRASMFYMQVKQNPDWNLRFWNGSRVVNVNELVGRDGNGKAINQWYVPYAVHCNAPAPCLVSISDTEGASSSGDTSVKNKSNMTDYLIISVNGSGSADSTNAQNRINDWNYRMDRVSEAGGMVEYISQNSAGVISPNDNSITNYIVFSGQIMLQPPLYLGYQEIGYLYYNGNNIRTKINTHTREILECEDTSLIGNNVTSIGANFISFATGGNLGGWFYEQAYPNIGGEGVTSRQSIIPYLKSDYYAHLYGEEYGDWMNFRSESGYDDIDKISILVCQLKIGNKYAVETDINNFEWLTQSECDSRGIPPTFTLGFNPAVDDYFLMKDWSISNNMSAYSNTDAEGTGIPIHSWDKLSGNVEFRILEPAYPTWYNQIRRHPSFWRSTKWWSTALPFMEFVGNIYIKNFECKLYSDNGQFNNTEERDLIYMSDIWNNSIQSKDDITFKFNTALTASEANEKGVSTMVKLSNVVDMINSNNVMNIRNSITGNVGKAEELYIDDYYKEYYTPKMIIDTSFRMENFGFFKLYRFSYLLNKKFYPIGYEADLKQDTVTIKMKEI